jgi:hypothetical protein
MENMQHSSMPDHAYVAGEQPFFRIGVLVNSLIWNAEQFYIFTRYTVYFLWYDSMVLVVLGRHACAVFSYQ